MVEKPDKARRRGFGLWMLLSLAALAVVSGVALAILSGRHIIVPGWMVNRVETQLGRALSGANVEIGRVEFVLGESWSPVVSLDKVVVQDAMGVELAQLAEIAVRFSGEQLLSGKLRPTDLSMSGVSFYLRRDPDGRFDLALETGVGPLGSSGTLPDILNSIEAVFDAPALSEMRQIAINGLSFEYEDVQAARYWVATQARAAIARDDDSVDMRLNFDLLYGGDNPAVGEMSVTSMLNSSAASLSARITSLPASDFSTQSPALAWLSVLDAPVTGAVRTELAEDGALIAMNGTLEIEEGALQPTEGIDPIRFQSGRAYFRFDPERQRITFDELSVVSETATLKAEGHGYLRDYSQGVPRTLLGQFQFSDITVNPEDSLDEPLHFTNGALDFRLRMTPFEINVGQFVLKDGETRIIGRGDVAAENEGWRAAVDVEVDSFSAERLSSLWPPAMVPNTRKWVVDNVLSGTIRDSRVNLRAVPGKEPVVSLSFKFSDAVVRYLKTLPLAHDGVGFASISGKQFSLVVEQGYVTAPNGGLLDAADTVLRVKDINRKPARMAVDLRVKGEIPAALSLLDEKPFTIMTRAGRPVDLADGQVVVTADLELDLIKRLKVDDVAYDVRAILQDVRSDKIVEDRMLTADALFLHATNDGVEISGPAIFGQVPIRAVWSQGAGPEHKGRSRVEGAVELSQAFIDEFKIGLPPGSVEGAAIGRFEIELVRGEAPLLSLVSDLNRVGLRIPALGWAKAANQTGHLRVEGSLGKPAEIKVLELEAPGLTAAGQVILNDDGTLDQLNLSRVQAGNWLDAPVVLTGRGIGQTPSILLPGGVVDIRGGGFGQGEAGQTDSAITTALDEVRISDSITLHDVRGDFRRDRGFRGRFSALVNGTAPVTGELIPQPTGTAVRIQSKDAGNVLGAVGILDKAVGGDLDLVLVPMAEEGVYDGQAKITNRLKVHGAPALADLLGAISVIGLLEQMSGSGLVFGTVDARFRLTPAQLIVSSGSAVGPSLGVSMNGYVDLEARELDMQGVISPIYLVNGIGALLTRKGEGLFGFNFNLTGPTSDPSTSVNPLSILTPGMFREIFRRPPPDLSE